MRMKYNLFNAFIKKKKNFNLTYLFSFFLAIVCRYHKSKAMSSYIILYSWINPYLRLFQYFITRLRYGTAGCLFHVFFDERWKIHRLTQTWETLRTTVLNVENHNRSAAKARARSTLIEDKGGKVSVVSSVVLPAPSRGTLMNGQSQFAAALKSRRI